MELCPCLACIYDTPTCISNTFQLSRCFIVSKHNSSICISFCRDNNYHIRQINKKYGVDLFLSFTVFRYKFHKIAFHTSLRQETIRKSKYFFTFTAVFSMYAIP